MTCLMVLLAFGLVCNFVIIHGLPANILMLAHFLGIVILLLFTCIVIAGVQVI